MFIRFPLVCNRAGAQFKKGLQIPCLIGADYKSVPAGKSGQAVSKQEGFIFNTRDAPRTLKPIVPCFIFEDFVYSFV